MEKDYSFWSSASFQEIRQAIEDGVSVNAEVKEGWRGGRTPLSIITQDRYKDRDDEPDIVKLMIESGANVNARDHCDGYSAIFRVVRNGSIETLRILIEAGADVNAKDIDNSTALMWAIYNEDPNVVYLLLKAGADVNVRNEDDMTAMVLAALQCDDPETITELISAGADVNERIKNCHSAFFKAKRNFIIRIACL